MKNMANKAKLGLYVPDLMALSNCNPEVEEWKV